MRKIEKNRQTTTKPNGGDGQAFQTVWINNTRNGSCKINYDNAKINNTAIGVGVEYPKHSQHCCDPQLLLLPASVKVHAYPLKLTSRGLEATVCHQLHETDGRNLVES